MFAFADRTDAALMAVGAASAVANGMAQPLMTFIFGDVIDAFGSAADSPDEVLRKVTKVRAFFSLFFSGGKPAFFSRFHDTINRKNRGPKSVTSGP
jgi:hypothetical protein